MSFSGVPPSFARKTSKGLLSTIQEYKLFFPGKGNLTISINTFKQEEPRLSY